MTGLLKEALYRDASDIHLVPERSVVWVRMRRDGILYDHDKLSRQEYPAVLSVVKLMSGMDINEKRLPQDGRLRYRAGNIKLDLRTSTVPTVYGERVVMRLLKSAEDIPEVEGLGFLPDTLERFKALISNAYGLILITGPTGSGKSFTNFSVLEALAESREEHPHRGGSRGVRDPWDLPGAGEAPDRPHLRQGAPLLPPARPRCDHGGEIRDAETAKIATEAALTGHLVLATLHTNDAPQAVLRLEEMGVERYNVARLLAGGALPEARAEAVPLVQAPRPSGKGALLPGGDASGGPGAHGNLYEPGGCEVCEGRGYKGRLPLHELLVVNDRVREEILRTESLTRLKRVAQEEGMRTLRQDGLLKAAMGLTTVQEVLNRTVE